MRADADRDRQSVLLRFGQEFDFVFAADMQKVRRLAVFSHEVEDIGDRLVFGMHGDQAIGGPGAVVPLAHGAGFDEEIAGCRIVVDLQPADARGDALIFAAVVALGCAEVKPPVAVRGAVDARQLLRQPGIVYR